MRKCTAAFAAALEEGEVRVHVIVTPKREVLDPQGQAVAHSLHALGFAEVQEVRIGKFIELEIEESDRQRAVARVEEMCRRLLANGVIEDFRFQIEGA